METRSRGVRSAPINSEKFITKEELSERRSLPLCPRLSTKMARRKLTKKTLFPSLPKAVFFKKPVSLSKLYNPERDLRYMDQIFCNNSKIGEGSFGEVYQVRSREDDKLYAIKQMKETHILKYGYAEVKNYEKIGNHDNCIKFFMAWEELQIIYIQMEYCHLSLAEYALRLSDIKEQQLWEIMYDILKALEYLHSKKLIHLDIKPGNIMMSKNLYKLGDFGLLVDLNEHDGQKISTLSDGDAKYLACEVLDGIYRYSCDIFGLGISLLELATNIELPEFGPLWHQIRKEHLPSIFYTRVSYDFAIIIEKMMAFVHWKRPTAGKILKFPVLKKISKNDQIYPRLNYSGAITQDLINANNTDKVIDTPRRPLYEVRNKFSVNEKENESSGKSYQTFVADSSSINPSRKGLPRTKLAF